jgi:hypothetical protein
MGAAIGVGIILALIFSLSLLEEKIIKFLSYEE